MISSGNSCQEVHACRLIKYPTSTSTSLWQTVYLQTLTPSQGSYMLARSQCQYPQTICHTSIAGIPHLQKLRSGCLSAA